MTTTAGGEQEPRYTRRGTSHGLLIGVLVAAVILFFCALIFAATRTPPPPATRLAVAPVLPLSAPSAVPTIALATLNKSAGATYFFIGAVNTTSLLTPPPMPITVARGEPIILSGWAVDTTAASAAGGVIFAVDETTTFQATYGLDRPDVAAALKSTAYQKSGFSAMLPANTLAPGRHVISIKIITADGTSYYAPSQAIEIEVA